MDTPNETPAPVVVTPIPAKDSRTILTGNILAWLGSVVALLPELLTDPVVAAFVNDFMSPWARRLVGVLVVAIGLWMKFLRNRTAAPIEGTPAALDATPAKRGTNS